MPQHDLLTLDDLRANYPAWQFKVTHIVANSGPGATRYSASLNGVLLGALSLTDLAEMIRREELARGW